MKFFVGLDFGQVFYYFGSSHSRSIFVSNITERALELLDEGDRDIVINHENITPLRAYRLRRFFSAIEITYKELLSIELAAIEDIVGSNIHKALSQQNGEMIGTMRCDKSNICSIKKYSLPYQTNLEFLAPYVFGEAPMEVPMKTVITSIVTKKLKHAYVEFIDSSFFELIISKPMHVDLDNIDDLLYATQKAVVKDIIKNEYIPSSILFENPVLFRVLFEFADYIDNESITIVFNNVRPLKLKDIINYDFLEENYPEAVTAADLSINSKITFESFVTIIKTIDYLTKT